MRRYTNEQLEEIASVELEKAKKYKGLYNKDLINIDLLFTSIPYLLKKSFVFNVSLFIILIISLSVILG